MRTAVSGTAIRRPIKPKKCENEEVPYFRLHPFVFGREEKIVE